MFQAQNIVKNFGQVKAVDGVSFAVEKPEMIGIIGRSGAGKSTLLRVINRLTDATSGAITYGDQELLSLRGKNKRAWQARCAMIFSAIQSCPAHGCRIERAVRHFERALHICIPVQSVSPVRYQPGDRHS